MTANTEPDRTAEFEAFIQGFEQALADDGAADVRDYLPPEHDTLYDFVLRELIRIDIEFSWQHTPRRLNHYLQQFPELRRNTVALEELAFEEYRLRRQAGESFAAEEYRREYGIKIDNWPALPELPVSMGYRTDGADARPGRFSAPPPGSWILSSFAPPSPAAGERLANPLLADILSSLPDVESTFLGFRLIAVLGRGAFGCVYLARQDDLAHRLVALKICVDISGESQLLAQLQHTNIVPIYSTHRAGLFQAVCMPYFGATTLADVLQRMRTQSKLPQSGKELTSAIAQKKSLLASDAARHIQAERTCDPESVTAPLPEAAQTFERQSYVNAVLSLMVGIADGLAHAHERGIVHRDLKPANILLTDDGRPMLVDFNLSADTKRADGTLAQVGGTLPYMSPEHLQAFQAPEGIAAPFVVDARSDLFSLGVILYQLLTGQFPFPLRQGAVHEILPMMVADRVAKVVLPRRHNKAITPAVQAVMLKLLQPRPEQRYQAASHLRADLQRQLAWEPLVHAVEPSLVERFSKWRRRHPRLTSPATLTVAALLLLSAGFALALWFDLNQVHHEKKIIQKSLHSSQGETSKVRQVLKSVERDRTNAEALLSETVEKNRLQELVWKLQRIEEAKRFRESVDLLRQHDNAVDRVQSGLDDVPLSQDDDLALDLELCRAALGRYKVLEDPDWHQAPHIRQLPLDEQVDLRGDVAELLYLINRETLFEIVPNHTRMQGWTPVAAFMTGSAMPWPAFDALHACNTAQIVEALRLSDIALACYQDTRPMRAVVMQRAKLTELLGRTDEAQGLLRRADGIIPRKPREDYLTAYEFAALGNFGAALAFVKPACDLDPRHASVWFLLGLCEANNANHVEAIRCYDVALALKPAGLVACFRRGLLHLKLMNAEQAFADFDRVLKANRTLVIAYVHRASALELLGQWDAAHKDLTEALRRRPDWYQLYYRRARIRERFGDALGAAADDRRFVERNTYTEGQDSP